MSTENITRVKYFEKQFLRTRDFATEQAYHIEMRRRHNIAHHYWGIVNGLELDIDTDGLFVKPGMAVDGYGRELVLALRKPLSINEFSAKASDELDVWLVYTRRSSDRAPEGYNSCDSEVGAEYYRWQEEPLVRLQLPEPGGTRPREPARVPREVLNGIGPHLSPPDDPKQQWPIYLGRILRDNTDPENPLYSVDMANRPYAGLIGNKIQAPSGRASIFLGNEVKSLEDNTQILANRFSVELENGECKKHEALRIGSDGEIQVNGKASIYGDVQLEGGAIEFKVSDDEIELPNVGASSINAIPHPWKMYRHKYNRTVIPEGSNTPVEEIVQDLRIEMSPEGGEVGEVVVGSWSPDESSFMPVLTVRNNGNVTVHGDLIVEGLTTGEVKSAIEPVARRMSKEAEEYLIGNFAGGVGGANLQLGKFYQSPFGEAFDLNTPEGIQNAIDYISEDAARTDALVDALFENSFITQKFTRKIMSEDSGRRIVMGELVDSTSALNGFAGLLQDNSYSDVLDPFALNMVLKTDGQGREAIMNNLASASSELMAFADLLTDARYVNRADEFADAVAKSDEGRNGFMQTLTPGSVELNSFAALLTETGFADRLSAFATNVMATEPGRRRTIEDGMPLNSAPLQNFAELLRDSYSDWLDQILDQIKLTNPGADAIANNLLENGSGRAAAVRDLMADVVRLQDFVNRVLDEQPGRKATADSFEGVDATDADANARRVLFSNLDWIPLGADATPTDWTDNYNRFANELRPKFCP